MNRTKFLEYNQEKNEAVRERYQLAMERISQIPEEIWLEEPYKTYFVKMTELFLFFNHLWEQVEKGVADTVLWSEINFVVRIDQKNPYGRVFLALYREIYSKMTDIYRCRLDLLTIEAELFLEVYSIFQDNPSVKQVEQALYWHNSDYTDIFESDVVERIFGIAPSYEEAILSEVNGSADYLYAYGINVSEKHKQLASYYNSLPYEEIYELANEAITQYLKQCNIEAYGKKKVVICFDMGQEPLVKEVMCLLKQRHIIPVLCPTEDVVPESVYDTKWVNKGFPWMDRQYKERKLQVLHTQLEQYKDVAGNYLPPLVFCSPQETKETAMENYTVLKGEYGQDYIEKQRKIWNEYFVQRKQLLAQYIPMI